ncbi:hypothetical protein KY330_03430 [Candidatus Woesearchaeota archaeon]|nr:hypothetical protein [Candidatus Woesearchaeota archaeon]
MEDISNKTLALLLVVAIAVSLVGIFTAQKGGVRYLTGAAHSGKSDVTFSTESVVSIVVTGDVDFGSGRVDTGQTAATLYSNGSTELGTWSFSEQPINVKNDGTQNVTLQVKSNVTAGDFLGGGTSPDFAFISFDGDASGACVSAISSYTTLTTSSQNVCTPLRNSDATNEANVTLKVVVPQDAPTGSKNAELNFTATAA